MNPEPVSKISDLGALRARATEIVRVLRYKRHCYSTHGIRAKFVSAEFLEHANEEQKHADQIAIESYREMISFIGQRDPTSRRLLESILAQEEEHAEDLVDLLEDLPKD